MAKVTLNSNGATTAGTSVLYTKAGGPSQGQYWCTQFYSDSSFSNEVFDVPTLPKKNGYTFTGYYTAASGGTQRIPSSGSILETSKLKVSSNVTWYAQWQIATYTLTFNPGDGGTVSPTSKSVTYNTAVGDLPTPTRQGFRFAGWFTSATGGKQVTNKTVFTWTANTTIYAHWDGPHTLTFDPNGGEVSPMTKSVFTGDAIGDIPTPTREHYHFDGWYTAGTGGTLVTSSTTYSWTSDAAIFAHWTRKPVLTFDPTGGEVSPTTLECWFGEALGALPRPTKTGFFFDGWFDDAVGGSIITAESLYDWPGDATIYAHWTENEQYRITFDPTGGITTEYERVVRPGDVVENLPTATLAKHTFGGWWTERVGGVQFEDGDTFDLHADLTLYAHWTRTEYTITFDAKGGTASFYQKDVVIHEAVGELPTCEKYANEFLGWYDAEQGGTKWTAATVFAYTSDIELYAHWATDPTYLRTLTLNSDGGTPATQTIQCTYGLEIGSFPAATKAGKKFLGWFYSGQEITPTTVCNWSGNRTATARWVDSLLGNVVDYFGFASSTLVPIASDSGDNRQRLCMYHTGACDASEVSGVWRNPTVTYAVIGNMTLNVTLGKAFAGRGNISGFMITTAEVHTQVGNFPTVTISAAANEGLDAINLFPFSVAIVARSKAQNLMGAISGGGKLNTMSVVASCDPVVIAENMMPVASDVVHGKVTASADTIAANNESAPTAAGGFTEIGTPRQCTEAYYSKWHIDAERDI